MKTASVRRRVVGRVRNAVGGARRTLKAEASNQACVTVAVDMITNVYTTILTG